MSASLGDYDNDGYLDMYVGEWRAFGYTPTPSQARLLHNLGAAQPGYFEDVTAASGAAMGPLSGRALFIRAIRLRHASSTSIAMDTPISSWPAILAPRSCFGTMATARSPMARRPSPAISGQATWAWPLATLTGTACSIG